MSLVKGVKGCLELGCCSYVYLDQIGSGLDQILFMECPAFTFIGQGKARVTAEEKRRNEREESFRIAGSFLSFMRVPPTL